MVLGDGVAASMEPPPQHPAPPSRAVTGTSRVLANSCGPALARPRRPAGESPGDLRSRTAPDPRRSAARGRGPPGPALDLGGWNRRSRTGDEKGGRLGPLPQIADSHALGGPSTRRCVARPAPGSGGANPVRGDFVRGESPNPSMGQEPEPLRGERRLR